ncbi:MAG TPA: hypothetical protein VF894_00270 [Anaeromyxobacter sp.]
MQIHVRHRALVVGMAVSALAVFGSGCATSRQMALTKETPAFAVGPEQSLALLAVKLTNVYKTGYQPHLKNLRISALNEKGEEFAFDPGEPFRASEAENDQYEEFLVSLALAPGKYSFSNLWIRASGGLVFGNGVVPINSSFEVPPGKAIYLGRIEVLRRERQGDEPRAGSVIPLIDQAVTGFSGGTFDVKLFDGYDHDLALMTAAFPALKPLKIEKQFLPPPRAKPPELLQPAAAPQQ